MTTEQLHDVIKAALRVAATAPARQAANTHTATVPWESINALRSSLEAAGVDWRKLNRSIRESKGYQRP